MKALVFVTLKQGVLDPQGQAVGGTLGRLGYEGVDSVRVGKYIELELGKDFGLGGTGGTGDAKEREAARARIGEMCERLLANTVIEDYRIELIESS